MSTESERVTETIGPEVTLAEEVPMVRQERWEELRRLWQQERIPVAQLARRFELDRKTVRRCVRDPAWRPYRRPAATETLLTQHAEYLRTRAPKVRYSSPKRSPPRRPSTSRCARSSLASPSSRAWTPSTRVLKTSSGNTAQRLPVPHAGN